MIRRRAFTAIELVLAVTIGAVFSLAVTQAVISVSGLATTLTREAAVENTARNVLDVATRAVRNARPVAQCQSPSTSSPASSCAQIVDRGTAFVVATPTRAVFFAYATRATSSTNPFAAPDLVEVKLIDVPSTPNIGRLCVSVYTTSADVVSAWPGITAAAPLPNAAPDRQTCVEPLASSSNPAQQLLGYRDASGATLGGTVAAGDLGKISYLRIAPVLEFNAATADSSGNRSRTRIYEQYVAVNAAVYAGAAR